MPSISDLQHTDLVLTNIAVDHTSVQTHIATSVFPQMNVPFKTAKIEGHDPKKESHRPTDDRRGVGAEFKSASYDLERSVTYDCIDHGVIQYVPNEYNATVNSTYQYLRDNVVFQTEKIMINREKALVDLLVAQMTTSTYTSTPGNKWDASAGTPVTDILAEINNASSRLVRFNAMALDINTLTLMGRNAELDTFAAGIQVNRVDLMKDNLAASLGISPANIFVADSSVNNANADETASMGRTWSDYVLMFFLEPPMRRSHNLGITPVWAIGDLNDDVGGFAGGGPDGFRTDVWDAKKRKSKAVVVSSYYDQVILNKDAGFLFSDVIT